MTPATAAIIAACLWVLAAAVASAFPTRRKHWPAAIVLMVAAVPLTVWLWTAAGTVAALVFLGAVVSVLRWPIRWGLRALRGRL